MKHEASEIQSYIDVSYSDGQDDAHILFTRLIVALKNVVLLHLLHPHVMGL